LRFSYFRFSPRHFLAPLSPFSPAFVASAQHFAERRGSTARCPLIKTLCGDDGGKVRFES
jgi:hypothetical protein